MRWDVNAEITHGSPDIHEDSAARAAQAGMDGKERAVKSTNPNEFQTRLRRKYAGGSVVEAQVKR